MFEEDDYKQLIADVLYNKDLISTLIYEKCSKPHISALPGDGRTNDPEILKKRKEEILKTLEKERQHYDDVNADDSALRAENRELSKVSAELKDASDYLGILNHRYASNYRKKFESAFHKYDVNDNFYTIVKDKVTNIKFEGNSSGEELSSRISSNLRILQGNLFKNSFLLTPKQMETYNQLLEDMRNFTSLTFTPTEEYIPHIQELHEKRIKACKQALKTFESLTEIPKEYSDAEQRIYDLNEKRIQNNKKIMENKEKIVELVKEGKASAKRIKDYEEALEKTENKLNKKTE